MIKYTLDLSHVTPMSRIQIEHLAHLAGEFSSRILFEYKNREINGKSMLGLLSLGMTGHQSVTLTVDGEDEETAAAEIRKVLETGILPPRTAADARQLMQQVKRRFADILNENLVGIYLYGSLAAGCFLWDRSDIDFLVVIRRPLPVEKKIALAEALYSRKDEAPSRGFECSVILEKYCRHMPYPIPFELHIAHAYRDDYERDPQGYCERMHGEDPDLTSHILALHAYGETLLGPDISRLFDQVSRQDALSAMRYDVNDAADHLHEKPCYYVLNLCRTMAYFRENVTLSKQAGGEWAMRHMAAKHQQVIQAALNAYAMGRDMYYDRGQAEDFCADALEEISR